MRQRGPLKGCFVRRSCICLLTLLVLGSPSPSPARAGWFGRWLGHDHELRSVNRGLKGRVLDYTNNSGRDRRIWSEALGEKRDVYVYVPPGYDPKVAYPLVMFFHGIAHDERGLLDVIEYFDKAIVCGQLPPCIIACPDGSVAGRPSMVNAGSFYINSKAGRFEDYVMQDIWGFLHRTFNIRPEREAHALVGGSMGGFGAFNLGIKYREQVSIVAGIFPPLNLRYVDCHGRYFSDFNPSCYGWRSELHPWSPVGRFFGVIVVRQRRLVVPSASRPST